MPDKYDSTVGVGYGEERKGARKRADKAGVKNAHGHPLIAELARGAAGKRASSRHAPCLAPRDGAGAGSVRRATDARAK